MNQDWLDFLQAAARCTEQENAALVKQVDAAYGVLRALGLEEASDVSEVIGKVATAVFAEKTIYIKTCVQLGRCRSSGGIREQ